MGVYISQYDEAMFPFSVSVDDSLREVLEAFVDSNVARPDADVLYEGRFEGANSAFHGTKYVFDSVRVEGYAFQVAGDLHYYYPPFNGEAGDGPTPETVWGTLDSITLGASIDSGGDVVDPFVTFTFDDPLYGDLVDGRANVVHDIIWGLVNGSLTGASDSLGTISQGGLLATLQSNGLDVDQMFADLVGIPIFTDIDLALAA